ncbi:MAG: hypothetical protein IJ605_00495 [Prevotella sp.]|nr:hypothetical protein [Prevotella sp.]
MRPFRRILTTLLTAQMVLAVSGAKKAASGEDSVLLSRVFTYAARMETPKTDSCTYAYSRFLISTDRRNILLMAVPTMYGIARGKTRQFAGESIEKITIDSTGTANEERILEVNTIRHGKSALSTLSQYLTPTIYGETILEGNLLSPFYGKNQRFYRYRFIHLDAHHTRITFKARVDNTQLVSGRATVENATGRIIDTDLYGEFDMVRFRLTVEMGKETLLPLRCNLMGQFKFLGSKISANRAVHYRINIAQPLPEGEELPLPETEALMNKIRPQPLPDVEQRIIDGYYREKEQQAALQAADTTETARKKDFARMVWNVVERPFINRFRSNFGANNEGFLRINPILNPLYMSYSDRRGFVYKFELRAGYEFTPNRDLTIRLKAGYSFKQRQFYYYIPFRFNYNKRRHAYFGIEIDHGRHIYNSAIEQDFAQEIIDSLGNIGQKLNYFRDTYINIYNNYDISDKWSFNVGMTVHRRRGITPEAFRNLGLPSVYHSTAPRVELQYRPLGWKGPILTLDYERGIKNFIGSDTNYERWEIDGSYIHALPRLQTWSMRLGGGFYSKRSGQQYFLDFANFRENNLPGGWNDDWSGDFELLSSTWYNSSRYYVRTNGTYESPLLLTSRLPWVGHFIEMERFYLGAVVAEELRPYVELGYGFTTRLFSVAAFVGSRNGRFESFGCSFGFELFRKW